MGVSLEVEATFSSEVPPLMPTSGIEGTVVVVPPSFGTVRFLSGPVVFEDDVV